MCFNITYLHFRQVDPWVSQVLLYTGFSQIKLKIIMPGLEQALRAFGLEPPMGDGDLVLESHVLTCSRTHFEFPAFF